jgi:hypothetical protein
MVGPVEPERVGPNARGHRAARPPYQYGIRGTASNPHLCQFQRAPAPKDRYGLLSRRACAGLGTSGVDKASSAAVRGQRLGNSMRFRRIGGHGRSDPARGDLAEKLVLRGYDACTSPLATRSPTRTSAFAGKDRACEATPALGLAIKRPCPVPTAGSRVSAARRVRKTGNPRVVPPPLPRRLARGRTQKPLARPAGDELPV